ncbi:MAG: DNA-binding protein [Candidatus Xenobia bacterium]
MKPRYRGWIHQQASYLSLAAGAVLVFLAPTPRAALAAAIYSLALVAMLTVSALYHRRNWSPKLRARMRSLDHATIFVLIAGSYTPFCLLALKGEIGQRLLVIAWMGAIAGIAQSIFWVRAPRALTACLYLALGWLVTPYLPLLAQSVGALGLSLIAAAGLFFTVGAVIYVIRRPNPAPATFGYHEVFHTLVTAACGFKFAAVALLVTRP